MSASAITAWFRRIREELPAVELGGFLAEVNSARRRLSMSGTWAFWEDDQSITLETPITDGTVSVTNGSTAVTGVGTGWTSGITGREFRKSGDSISYEITFLTATTATIDPVYQGDTESGAEYVIFRELYSLQADTKKIISVVNLSVPREMIVGTRNDYIARKRLGNTLAQTAFEVAIWSIDSSGNRQLAFLNAPVTGDEVIVYFFKRPTDIVDIVDIAGNLEEPVWFHEVIYLELLGRYLKRQNPRNEPRIAENRREFGEALGQARAEDSTIVNPRRRNSRQFLSGIRGW